MFFFSFLRVWFVIGVALVLIPSGEAAPTVRERVAEAYRFTVKVAVQNGDLFSGSVSAGHGTGFIVKKDSEWGYVYTNRHVIQHMPWQSQSIKLEFRDGHRGDSSKESVPAEIFYKSALHDFAIVRFKLSDLGGELLERVSEAPLATDEEMQTLALAGGHVIVVGNPLDTEAVVTTGIITNQSHQIPWSGEFLQTSAQINPGNSGGPMIDLETGKVMGICTLKNMNAEGMGFALPISVANKEAVLVMEGNASLSIRKHLPFLLHPVQIEQIEAFGLRPVLTQQYPNQRIFQTASELYIVLSSKDPGVQPHDIILTANGEFVGDYPFVLRRAAQHSDSARLKLEVLRDGKVVATSVAVIPEGKGGENSSFEFVSFSGAIFGNVDAFDSIARGGDGSSVRMLGAFPGTLGASELGGLIGSAVEKIAYNGKVEPVGTITELKARLKKIVAADPQANITLYFVAPVTGNRGGRMILMPGVDRTKLLPFQLPLSFLIDDEMVNFAELRNRFDFTGFKNPETRMGLAGLLSCARQIAAQ